MFIEVDVYFECEHLFCIQSFLRIELFAGNIPTNNMLFAGTVLANKVLFAGTVRLSPLNWMHIVHNFGIVF